MTVVRLSDEILPAFPDKPVAVFYSTKPFDVEGFLKEVSGLDAVILRGVGTEGTRPIRADETVTLGDIVLVNQNHNPQFQSGIEERPRKNYAIAAENARGTG